MEVRDDEQQTPTVEQARRRLPWRDMLGHVPAVLLVGGLLMYAFLSFCYARFYGSLGIDPNDVGLSYSGTLTRSSGLVVGFLIVLLVNAIVFQFLSGDRFFELLAVLALLMMCIGVIFSVYWTGTAADQVRAGKAVSPMRFWMAPIAGFEVLAIHAAPATVEPVGKPDDSPAAERLQGRRLLYLGQSSGTVVLYDAATQRAVYVPASSVILHVANCDANPPPDPVCGTRLR
jgi:hypothetical protein